MINCPVWQQLDGSLIYEGCLPAYLTQCWRKQGVRWNKSGHVVTGHEGGQMWLWQKRRVKRSKGKVIAQMKQGNAGYATMPDDKISRSRRKELTATVYGVRACPHHPMRWNFEWSSLIPALHEHLEEHFSRMAFEIWTGRSSANLHDNSQRQIKFSVFARMFWCCHCCRGLFLRKI